MDYAIRVVPNFPPLSPSTQSLPTPSGNCTLFIVLTMSMDHVYMFFGYCISYAILYILRTIP